MNDNGKCDVCGKDLSDPVRSNKEAGLRIGLRPGVSEDNRFIQSQFGKYKPGVYHACMECVLKAFGVKPNREPEDAQDQEKANAD